jgi:hypothetical protein
MVDHNQEDLLTRSIKNNSCAACREIYKLPMCRCKKPGGGGKEEKGGQGDSLGSAGGSNSDILDTSSKAAIDALIVEFEKTRSIWIQSELLSDKKINNINDEVGLIAFEYDKLRGNITIQCKPSLTKKEEELVREFLKKIESVFEQFKNQLADQSVLTHQFIAQLKNNGLSIEIHVPNSHYNELIKFLDNKNLLPMPTPWQKNKKKELDAEEGYQPVKRPLPSPFGNIKEGPKKI